MAGRFPAEMRQVEDLIGRRNAIDDRWTVDVAIMRIAVAALKGL
jgi:hypothetical protein